MKTKFSILVCLLVIQFAAKAQMKIGDSATTINSASLLELQSTNKGLAFPRISLTSTSASTPLPTGLLVGTVVYNTNASVTGGNGVGLYVWDGSVWMSLASGSSVNSLAWSLVGNAGLSSLTNFIGTTDAIDFVTRTNNIERMRILGANNGSSKAGWIGMGVTIPRSSLDVAGDYTNKNVVTIQNTSTTGFSSIDMLDNTGALKGTFGYANTAVGGNFGGRTYFNSYGSDMLLTANSGSAHIFLKGSTGFIGINTFNPTNALTVLATSNPLFLSGVQATSTFTTDSILTINGGVVKKTPYSSLPTNYWSLTGNSGTNSAINFLGTADNHPLKFRVNNILAAFIDSTGGGGNAFFGDSAGLSNTTGVRNTAIGQQALSFNTTTSNNVAIGYQSLYNNTGTGNTAAGYSSMSTNTTGQYNAAYGFYALKNNTTGSYNVAVGQSALQNNTTGANNSVIGEDGLLSNTTGRYLAGLGTNALYSNTTGNYSVAVGESTLYNNTTGAANIAIGSYSLFSNTTSNNNIGIGYYAGNLTTGANNVFIGYQSGQFNTTGSNNTLLGNNTSLLSAALTNASAIGYNAKVAASNSLVLGDSASATTAVNVGIGVRSPIKRLHIDAATIGLPSQNDSLKIDHLASSFSPINKSILVIDSATGYVSRQSINTLATGNFWSLTGNTGTNYATNFLGTTDNTSLRFRTNNTEQMIIDSLGRVGIGSSAFNTLNPAKLLVDYGNSTSNSIVNLKGSIDDYFQINLQNKSASANASSDYVATADDGTDSTNYIDMGINSSAYAASADNFGGPHDGYLYTNSKNLLIGTAALNSDVVFLLGGGRQRNAIMRLNASDYSVVIGKGDGTAGPLGTTLRGPSALSTAANTAGSYLNISGGASTGTATGGALNLNGGATSGSGTGGSINITGGSTTGATGGAVNINASSANATNINTGTSVSNITLGGAANNVILPKFSTVGGIYYTSVNTGQLSTTGANMIWDSINNRLGIGKTTPSEKLDIVGNLRLSGAFMPNNNPGAVGQFLISTGAGSAPTWFDASNYAWQLDGNPLTAIKKFGTTTNYDIPFITNNIERMRLTAGGLLGIGVTNPQQALSVGNGINIDQNDVNAGTVTNALTFGFTSGEGIGSKRTTGGNRFGLDFYTGSTNRMVITNGGAVGINNTTPTEKLDVTGNVRFSGALMPNNIAGNSGYLLVSAGAGTAPVWTDPATVTSANSWQLDGNALTGIKKFGTTTNIDIPFVTNNTEKMRLTAGGSLGIGVTNPQQALSVGSGITIDQNNTNTGTAANALIFGNGSGEAIGSKRSTGGNQNGLDFYTSYNNRMVITNGGFVGIGTTAPSNVLSISGTNPLYLSGLQATTTFSADSILTVNGGVVKKTPYSSLASSGNWSITGNAGTVAGTNFLGTTDAIDFVAKTNNTERLRITSGGLVGIGTNTPASDLTIYQSSGSGNSKGFTFTGNSIGGTNSGTGFLMSLGYNTTGNKQLWVGDADYAGNAAGSFARFAIGGTAFPTLDAVSGNNAVRKYLALGVAGDANSGVIFGGDNTNVSPGSQVWDNGNMTIGAGYKSFAAPTNGLLVQGNVGIGTGAPSNALSVIASNPMYLSGLTALTAFAGTDSVLTISGGVVKKIPSSVISGSSGSGWSLTGNSGTNPGTNFLGTTDAQPLIIKSLNRQLAYFDGNLYNIALGFGAANNVSDHNVAIGYNAATNNQYTLALGYSATASGVRSVAIGNGGTATIASGAESVAIGFNATATADQTVALGYQTRASGQYGVAIGYNPTASGSQSVAIGYQAQATQQYSSAIGYQAQATGLQSTAIGNQAQTAQANTILLGNASQGNLYVGIGTATPTAKLHIVGGTTTNYPLQMTGLPTGTVGTDNILTINSSGVVGYVTSANFNSNYWGLNGNAGTVAGTNFLGTTDANDVVFKTNSIERMRIVNGVSSSTGTSGDITIGDATSGTVRSNKEFVMKEDGDQFGPSVLRLRNRNGENGAIFETIGASAALVDFLFKTGTTASPLVSNIRFETRAIGSGMFISGNSMEWQIGQPANPTFIVSAASSGNSALRIGNLGIGNVNPTEKLDVTGNMKFSGALMPNNSAGTTGYILASAGAGTAPVWTDPAVITSASSWQLDGNALAAIKKFGTTTNLDIPFITNNVERMRLTAGGLLGIGTSTPNTNAKVDVAGSFKLGTAGTVQKNIVSAAVGVNTLVQPQFSAVTLLGISLIQLNAGTNYTDVTLTLPSTLSSTQATVAVSPSFDLPAGVSIAFARLISTTQVKVRFTNANTGSQTISGNLYLTVTEF